MFRLFGTPECCTDPSTISLKISSGIDESKISASFKKGVLTITVPKTEPEKSKARTISIKPEYAPQKQNPLSFGRAGFPFSNDWKLWFPSA